MLYDYRTMMHAHSKRIRKTRQGNSNSRGVGDSRLKNFTRVRPSPRVSECHSFQRGRVSQLASIVFVLVVVFSIMFLRLLVVLSIVFTSENVGIKRLPALQRRFERTTKFPTPPCCLERARSPRTDAQTDGRTVGRTHPNR